MDLQYNNYKPQDKHVGRRMFPSRSKKYFQRHLRVCRSQEANNWESRMLSSFFLMQTSRLPTKAVVELLYRHNDVAFIIVPLSSLFEMCWYRNENNVTASCNPVHDSWECFLLSVSQYLRGIDYSMRRVFWNIAVVAVQTLAITIHKAHEMSQIH